MFEAIRNNKRVAQVILAVLIIPFAAFGIDSYFGGGPGGGEIATVGGTPIYQTDFNNALEEEQRRYLRERREQFGEEVSPAMLDSEKLRRSVLDRLVIRRVLELYAKDMRLTIFGGQLQQALAGIEAFQENGRFSLESYQKWLGENRMTPAVYEKQVAQDLLNQQLMDWRIFLPPVARSSALRVLAAELEKRAVREMRFPVAPHLTNIKVDDAVIRKFYDDNPAQFQLPERIKAEYLVFSEEALANKIEIGETDIQKVYQGWPEERRVRHILIESFPASDEAAMEAARKEAEEIAAILRSEPDRFQDLAREKSKDPGSSDVGGDLGYVAHGTMDSAFEEAVFTLKQGEISDPVHTKYGFHIIQVTATKKRPLDEVRDEIVERLRRQALKRDFNEKTSKFSDMVYNEAFDSLQPAAEAFGLEIRRTDWINRGTDTLGGFRNERLVASLFEDDALKQHHNTQAIDVGTNTLVSARVLEHEAARLVPFEDARGGIEAKLRREEAMRMAREEGNAALEALDRGEAVNNAWSTPRSFQRDRSLEEPTPDLPLEAAKAVFAASLSHLPSRVAVMLPDDAYVIYQVDSVTRPSIDDDDQRIADITMKYGMWLGESDLEFFLLSLRDRYKVVIKPVTSQAEEE
ncbi:MAG: SurA N-terminal domain-containing protein [Azoarcus sp.]|nr:SurA N-terminal domain-containing protein [Azoarcus sp.]